VGLSEQVEGIFGTGGILEWVFVPENGEKRAGILANELRSWFRSMPKKKVGRIYEGELPSPDQGHSTRGVDYLLRRKRPRDRRRIEHPYIDDKTHLYCGCWERCAAHMTCVLQRPIE